MTLIFSFISSLLATYKVNGRTYYRYYVSKANGTADNNFILLIQLSVYTWNNDCPHAIN